MSALMTSRLDAERLADIARDDAKHARSAEERSEEQFNAALAVIRRKCNTHSRFTALLALANCIANDLCAELDDQMPAVVDHLTDACVQFERVYARETV